MAEKLHKMTPLQQKAVEADVTEHVRSNVRPGDQTVVQQAAEYRKSITGSAKPGVYTEDHKQSVDDHVSAFIKREYDRVHKRPSVPVEGSVVPIPLVPLVPVDPAKGSKLL